MSLKAVHKQWALWATKKFKYLYPSLEVTLYESGWNFTICILNCPQGDLAELRETFKTQIKPMTCSIELSDQIPNTGELVKDTPDYGSELWLNGEPLSVPTLNNLLSLAVPNFPLGTLDYDNEHDDWVFHSTNILSTNEKESVQAATKKVGLPGPVRFVTVPAVEHIPPPILNAAGSLNLVTAREIGHLSHSVRQLVQKDEDEWRKFLESQTTQKIADGTDFRKDFSCLFDTADQSDIRLSELLTIYDHIDLIPKINDLSWLERHRLSLPELQELVNMKRIRIILPYSIEKCPANLLNAVSEVDRSSLVLSRSLASKTILHGQKKEPMLYAPLTAAQRAAILLALSNVTTDQRFRSLIEAYGRLFQRQHDLFMIRGALASLGFSVGAYLGETFYTLRQIDRRIELSTCGASIEWALSLGSSYIPRKFEGYDETSNSLLIASFLGHTSVPFSQTDPITDRMHTVLDGLLTLSDVPPMEVARNFNSISTVRFRELARNLMRAPVNTSELEIAVEKINADVNAFERRRERLAACKLDTLGVGILGAALDPKPPFGSVIGAWIYDLFLRDNIPASVRRELAYAKDMLIALATASSLDAVIVSRSRKVLRGQ